MKKSIIHIAKLSSPIMFSFFISMLFGLVDTIYAGVIGDYAITAISYFIPIEFIFMAVYVGAQVACNVYFSRSLGENNIAALKEYYAAAKHLLKYLFIGVFILALLIISTSYFLPFSDNVLTAFREYSTFRLAGMLFFMIPVILFDSVLRSHEKMKESMKIQIAGNLMNIILNSIFVFVFHWGVIGLGFATFLSWGVTALLAYTYTRQFKDFIDILKIKKEKSELYFKKLVSLAFFTGFRDVFLSLEMFFIAFILTGISEIAVGANGIVFRYGGFAIMPLIAVFIVMNTILGHDLGRKDYVSMKKHVAAAIIFTIVCMMFVLVPLFYFLDKEMIALVTNSKEIGDYALTVLKYIPWAFITMAPFIIFHSFAQVTHNTKLLIWMPILRYVIISFPLYFLLGRYYGFSVVLVAPIIANFIASIIYFIQYKRISRKLNT